MKISTKGRHAVRIMADIAKSTEEFTSINEISKRQNISLKYCEKIISMLTKANLLISMRGTNGGYKLAKSPENCSVFEILEATGDGTKIATCTSNGKCERIEDCDTMHIWVKLTSLINNFLKSITLADLTN